MFTSSVGDGFGFKGEHTEVDTGVHEIGVSKGVQDVVEELQVCVVGDGVVS